MKRQKGMVICSIILLVLSLSGCAKKQGFTIGNWNGNTYENPWLDMQFKVPQEWNIATKEEINATLGAGAAALDIEGTSAEQLKAVAELKSIFAFMVGDKNGVVIQLMYENLLMSKGGLKYTESKFLEELKDMLLKQTDFQYEFIKYETVKIAGKDFLMAKFSAYEGNMLQEYYCFKLDTFMVGIIASYTPEQEGAKIDFMNNIALFE